MMAMLVTCWEQQGRDAKRAGHLNSILAGASPAWEHLGAVDLPRWGVGLGVSMLDHALSFQVFAHLRRVRFSAGYREHRSCLSQTAPGRCQMSGRVFWWGLCFSQNKISRL